MPLVAVGLSHRSAPLPLLERVAVQPEDLGKALAHLVGGDDLTEVVILSTCMRTEVYAHCERFHSAVSDVQDFMAATAGLDTAQIGDHSYSFHDAAAVTHLFRVAAGLDSAVLGEGEILGQVREGWERAMVEATSGPVLNALFRHGIEAGKRARAETAISRGTTSVPQAAVRLAAREYAALAGGWLARDPVSGGGCTFEVLVVGAGATGSVVASTVAAEWSPSRITVASRAQESAEALCRRLGQEGYAASVPTTLDALRDCLAGADVVFSATSSPAPVITRELFVASGAGGAAGDGAGALVKGHIAGQIGRGGAGVRRRVIVDVAVPRDVEEAVGELEGVSLFDIESIGGFVESEMAGRAAEVDRVVAIVEEEVARYLDAASARHAAPLISALRSRAEEIRGGELARYRRRLASLSDDERRALETLTRALVAKMLHEPTVRLKTAAGTPRGERLSESLRELFDL